MTYIDACFYRDGMHFPGRYCPHDADEDETGLVYPEDWTAQQEM